MKSKNRVDVTWFGHSAFLFQAPGGKRVLVDPWLTNPKAPVGGFAEVEADLILVTHGHEDHIGETVSIALRTGATVACIFELSLWFKKQGLHHVIGFNKGGTIRVGDVAVTMTDAKHSADIEQNGMIVAPGGEAAGFVIRLENGYRVYHAGDTALFSDMKLIGEHHKPDLCVLPIGGVFTMDPEQAAYACRMIRP